MIRAFFILLSLSFSAFSQTDSSYIFILGNTQDAGVPHIGCEQEFCKKNSFENNIQQIEIVNLLDHFINPRKTFLSNFFKDEDKLCFYLYGNVGVGKTMILNFFYHQLKVKKLRLHFNEFMINFHDFRHKNKVVNSLDIFVKRLKKHM